MNQILSKTLLNVCSYPGRPGGSLLPALGGDIATPGRRLSSIWSKFCSKEERSKNRNKESILLNLIIFWVWGMARKHSSDYLRWLTCSVCHCALIYPLARIGIVKWCFKLVFILACLFTVGFAISHQTLKQLDLLMHLCVFFTIWALSWGTWCQMEIIAAITEATHQ